MFKATDLADQIADIVLVKYYNLPAKFKPTKDGHGISNWSILSGIVLEHGDRSLECVSLATGMKCLPASKVIGAQGRILHDSHAEMLALRTFNLFLLQECSRLLHDIDIDSKYLMRTPSASLPFTIRSGMKIHLYCSEAPCGDASMEVIMQQQDDATPWTSILPAEGLLGRGHFDQLGVVRRKPSRADSPESLSKSCSDKLAMKQCLSILSSTSALFVSPENAYLSSLIISESQYDATAMQRCFGADGRMATVEEMQGQFGYSFKPFRILTTSREFDYSKRSLATGSGSPKPSSLSIIWSPCGQEVIINGVLQGRKQTDTKCASMVAQARLAALSLKMLPVTYNCTISTYSQLKSTSHQLQYRKSLKLQVIHDALQGWISNIEDDFAIT